MSVYKGSQGRGARQRLRDEKYYAAVGRQLLNLERGELAVVISPLTGRPLAKAKTTPAPIEKFLRNGDSVGDRDFLSYATGRVLGAVKGGTR